MSHGGVEWITTDTVFEFLDVPRLKSDARRGEKVKACDGGAGWIRCEHAR